MALLCSPLCGVATAFFLHEALLQGALNGLVPGTLGAIGMLFSRNLYWFKKGNRIDWRV